MHVDFSEVLAAIKKYSDHTDLSEDMTRLIKNVQEMSLG